MFRFPSVICTRCTGFFCLAIIKGPPNDIYCIIEEPYKHYFTEKVSYSLYIRYEIKFFFSNSSRRIASDSRTASKRSRVIAPGQRTPSPGPGNG